MIQETSDIDIIKKVLCDPEIYERITSDSAPDPDDWIPPLEGEHYLAGYVNGELAAIFNMHPITKILWEGHMQVLKEYRKHAHSLFADALSWVWENTPALKMVVQIPVIYPEVAKFISKHGFELEGVNRRSHLKNGVLLDQVYMGLSNPMLEG